MTARPDRIRQLEEQIAALAAEVDRMKAVAGFELTAGVLAAARQRGYDEAAAEYGGYRPAARAQHARAELRVLPGGAA